MENQLIIKEDIKVETIKGIKERAIVISQRTRINQIIA